MRLIYIAGTSHSGSTLLDLMLNAHPEIFSAGEVLKLNRQLGLKNAQKQTYAPCSCGAPSLWQCALWSGVDQRTRETAGKSLADLDMQDYGELDGTRAPNDVVFNAIADVSGKNFVVDSSKLPKRLSALMRLKELDIYPVHLIRDPKGQINSVARKHGGFLKHIFRYELIHEQIRRALKSVPHSVVRYEDLVRDPEPTLRSVSEPLGLEFDPRQLAWAEAERHEVAGNHIRFDATSTLVLDEAWREGLSRSQQLAIDMGTVLSRQRAARTGYVTRD
jgi:Sulfotransferase family